MHNDQTLRRSLFFTTAMAALFLVGCQSYNQQSSDLSSAWKAGDLPTAVAEVQTQAEKAKDGRDELLWRLEEGAILRAADQPVESTEALDRADAIASQYEEEAKVKLGSETVAIFTNQATLPYRGRAYDKIMMNTYKALNYLELGDADAARVELNRAFQRQEDAVIENRKRIEEAVEAADKAKRGELAEEGKKAQSYDVERAQSDPKFAGATASMLAEVDSRIRPYADYVNPFTVFLDGLYFSQLGLDNADIERARKSFERVKGMSPGTYIAADYEMVEKMATGQATAEPVTYVIFATGSAPQRDEFRVDIPLFLVSSVSYVGASFPKLDYIRNHVPSLTATTTDGGDYTTQLIADMDAVVSKDFKNEWPLVLTKTLISSGAKAMAGYAAEKAVENQGWQAQLIAKAVNIGAQAATNRADLRTWKTLPKKFAYARVPTPEDGVINLSAGMWQDSVMVDAGKTNIIYVRSVNDVALPTVSYFAL